MSDMDTNTLRNDPNRALRDRIDPEERTSTTAQDALTLVLSDLHEAARGRVEGGPRAKRRLRRH
jgi:hypothetical protein